MNAHMRQPPAEKTPKLHSPPAFATRERVLAPRNTPRGLEVTARSVRQPLNDREKQILRLVCDGLTNAEIARRLGIAPDTVKSELKRIFRKLEAKNRTQAAILLVQQGLF